MQRTIEHTRIATCALKAFQQRLRKVFEPVDMSSGYPTDSLLATLPEASMASTQRAALAERQTDAALGVQWKPVGFS